MTYEDLLTELKSFTDKQYGEFNNRIVNDKHLKFFGVRTSILRQLTKKHKGEENIFSFPDEYYEVVFIKLAIASTFSYDKFVSRIDEFVPLITDWALCDSALKPACVKKHKDDFAQYIKKYISKSGEFKQRFALISLLNFYVEEKWLPFIKQCVEQCDSSKYYTMMGAAWLICEVVVRYYDYGLTILQSTMCDITIKNKAISKCCDSFRLTQEQKNQLKELRTNFAN